MARWPLDSVLLVMAEMIAGHHRISQKAGPWVHQSGWQMPAEGQPRSEGVPELDVR